MASIAELALRITADIAQVEKNMPKVQSALQGLQTRIDKAATGSKALLGGLTAVAVGAVAFGVKAVAMAGQLEQTQVAFTTMLGSAEKATALMKELQQFGAETPFEFPEIQQSAKSLLAFGVAAGDVTETLRRVGDIASGVGAPLGEIAELYGKAKTQGRLFAEDINQLTGRGIPIIKELASQFKVSESEVKTLVESGKIGFPQMELAFKNMTAAGSQFGGMMDAQSKTLPGMWSNLMDNIGQASVAVGQELIAAFDIKDKLAGVIGSLGELSALLQSEGLKGALEKLFPPDTHAKLVMIAGAIAGGISVALYSLAGAIWIAMAPLIPFMAAGAALAGLAYLIYTNWEPITEFFRTTWAAIVTWLMSTWDSIIAIWDAITSYLSATWGSITETATAAWDAIKAWFATWWETLLVIFTGPIGLLALLIIKNWDDINAYTSKVWSDIVEAVMGPVNDLKDKALAVFDKFKEGLELFAGMFRAIFRGDLENTLEYFTDLISYVFGWDNPMTQAIVGFAYKITSFLATTWDGIKQTFGDTFGGMIDSALDFGKRIMQALKDGIGSVKLPVPSFKISFSEGPLGIQIPKLDFGVNWKALRDLVPFLANGGNILSAGAAIVGERGPELLTLPKGAQVSPLSKGSGGAGVTVIYNQNAPVYGALDFEQKVKSTIRDAIQGGAFRGVIATP